MKLKKLKLNIYILILALLGSVLLIGCGEKIEEEKPVNNNPYGTELSALLDADTVFVCNLDYDVNSNFKWYSSVSLDGVVIKQDEAYTVYDDSKEGTGQYNSKFSVDEELTKTRRVVISFEYNDNEKSVKHPKIYEFRLAAEFDGTLALEKVTERNINGVDEAEHNWIHYDAQKMTCKQDGWTEYDECSICNEKRGYTFIPSVGGEHQFIHTSDSPTPSKEMPIHSEETCSKCGETTGQYDNALNRNNEGMNNLNILLIGNSYTNYNTMMNCLKGIIEGEGIAVNIVKVSYGSQYLYDYIEGPNGDYYYKVKEAVEKTKFDIVFLQDQSTNPATNPANFYDSTRDLYNYFTKLGTTCIMYETWTRNANYSGWTKSEMAQRLSASYCAIADELGLRVSHAGTAVYYLMNQMTELPSHKSDNSHPSSYSSYLVALCHYVAIYGRSPKGIHYTYNDYMNDASIEWHDDNPRVAITTEQQAKLEQIVYDAMFGPSIITSQYKTSSVGVTERN